MRLYELSQSSSESNLLMNETRDMHHLLNLPANRTCFLNLHRSAFRRTIPKFRAV